VETVVTEESAETLGLAKYLKKPLDMQTLAEAVRVVLDR
jgi:DNA-binding response OmpR family regulator